MTSDETRLLLKYWCLQGLGLPDKAAHTSLPDMDVSDLPPEEVLDSALLQAQSFEVSVAIPPGRRPRRQPSGRSGRT